MTTTLTAEHKKWRRRVFLATWMSYFGFYFCRKGYGVLKSTLGRDLNMDATDLAHIWTAFLVAYMVGQFVAGSLGRKTGPRVLLLWGMVISLLANVACGFSNTFATLMAFMILNGFAQAAGWPGNVGSMAQWFRRTERGTVMGLWSTCYQIGSVAAKAFAAFLLGWLGLAWSFFGGSLVLAAIWVLFLLFQRDKPEDLGLAPIVDDEPDDNQTQEKAKQASTWQLLLPVLLNRTVLIMGMAYFCIKFLRYAVDSWLPFFLDTVYHMTPEQAGYSSTLFDVFGFLGAITAGVVSDKVFKGRRAMTCIIMCAGMTVAYFLLFKMGDLGIVYLLSFYSLIGFMLYGPDSLLSAAGAIDESSKESAVLAVGIINGLGSIGPIFQEELISWLYESSGHKLTSINIMFILVSILSTMLVFLLYLHDRKKRRLLQEATPAAAQRP